MANKPLCCPVQNTLPLREEPSVIHFLPEVRAHPKQVGSGAASASPCPALWFLPSPAGSRPALQLPPVQPLDGSVHSSFTSTGQPASKQENWALSRESLIHRSLLSFQLQFPTGKEAEAAGPQQGWGAGAWPLPAGSSEGSLEMRCCLSGSPDFLPQEQHQKSACLPSVGEKHGGVLLEVLSPQQEPQEGHRDGAHQARGRLPHPSRLRSPGSRRTPRCPSHRPRCCSGSNWADTWRAQVWGREECGNLRRPSEKIQSITRNLTSDQNGSQTYSSCPSLSYSSPEASDRLRTAAHLQIAYNGESE